MSSIDIQLSEAGFRGADFEDYSDILAEHQLTVAFLRSEDQVRVKRRLVRLGFTSEHADRLLDSIADDGDASYFDGDCDDVAPCGERYRRGSFADTDKYESGADYGAPPRDSIELFQEYHGSRSLDAYLAEVSYLLNMPLQQHASILERADYTSLLDLSTASIHDLEELGLLKGHALGIVRALRHTCDTWKDRLNRQHLETNDYPLGLRSIDDQALCDPYFMKVWGVDFFNEANGNGPLKKLMKKFAPAMTYMMKIASTLAEEPRSSTIDFQACWDSTITQSTLAEARLSGNASNWKRMWEARFNYFTRDTKYTGTPRELELFLKGLSKFCGHNDWQIVRGNAHESSMRREKLSDSDKAKVQDGRFNGVGPIEGHMFAPPRKLRDQMSSVYKKHTSDGKTRAKEQMTPNQRREAEEEEEKNPKSEFYEALINKYSNNHLDWSKPGIEKNKELFYLLIKNAVIATLHSGCTVLEKYPGHINKVNNQPTQNYTIIAKHFETVGVFREKGPSLYYRVAFLGSGIDSDDNKLPVVVGVYPVAPDEFKGIRPEYLQFDHDDHLWFLARDTANDTANEEPFPPLASGSTPVRTAPSGAWGNTASGYSSTRSGSSRQASTASGNSGQRRGAVRSAASAHSSTSARGRRK